MAALCVLVCYCIELSQLYQADWINTLRSTRLGGLVLGFGFLWSDLVCYFVGTLLGVGLEYVFLKRYI
ncbi:ribosomal maturation YjgA family protein [Salmonirosea aquatica]|uniref:ribosomal maturation YjgA family protein n=1 Tax=Salmonirosea aquatica TaxID=2654236 RepID=UPI00357171F0